MKKRIIILMALLLYIFLLTRLCAQQVYLGYTSKEIDKMAKKCGCDAYNGTVHCYDHYAFHEFNKDDGSCWKVSVVAEQYLVESMVSNFNSPPFIQVGRGGWIYLIYGKVISIEQIGQRFIYTLR